MFSVKLMPMGDVWIRLFSSPYPGLRPCNFWYVNRPFSPVFVAVVRAPPGPYRPS
jgi:hypothetical protein